MTQVLHRSFTSVRAWLFASPESGRPASSASLPKRSSILALLAAAALGVLLLLPGGALQAQSNTIEFPENSKDPVATFTADDPEGSTSITWSLATPDQVTAEDDLDTPDNADATHFDIDGKTGVLTFDIGDDSGTPDPSVAPDFEAPRGTGPVANDNTNTYKVVVAASDGATPARIGYHKVTVKVTDVDEPGKVSWTVDHDADGTADTPKLVQFDVGTILTASATDGDIAGTAKAVATPIWRWYRSPDKASAGTLIETTDAQDNTYTTTLDDSGMYLRVVAHYVVTGNVAQETASLTSDYPVLAERIGPNKLKFDPPGISRSVAEGDKDRNVGAPVTATGSHGAVNYEIVTGGDSANFDIDQKTGQITTAVKLDREAAAGDPANCATTQNECTVTVRATDASGSATATTATADPPVFVDATVTIKITDVDEKPTFPTAALTAITRPENTAALAGTGDEATVTYTATDPEGRNITYALMGPDGAKFQLNSTRILSFKAKPDYEMRADANRDNVYEVTVRASDGTMHADRAVKVTITGEDEAPVVAGRDSVSFPENSKNQVATYTATDPEGSTSITWSLATPDQVTAEDDLDTPDNADATHFDIDGKTGVLTFDIGDDSGTPDPSVAPDFEAPRGTGPASGTNTNTYKVVVAASDGTEVGYRKVTVKVTDVAETGKVTWTVDHDADGTADTPKLVQFDVGTILTASATDGDIAGTAKAVAAPGATNLIWRWQRGGSTIEGATTNAYTVDLADVGHTLRVVATYQVGTSTRQETASLSSDYPVRATRVGPNKLKFDPSAISRSVTEGDKDRNVGAPVRATGNHGAVNYEIVTGGDSANFDIDQKTGQITTAVKLDREAAAGDPANCATTQNECTVTVRATDASGSATATTATADPPVFVDATVTIKITDVDERPTFTTTGGTAESPETVTLPENSKALFSTTATGFTKITEVSVTYAAMDQDGLNVNLSLMGPDAAQFSLSTGGVLSFVKAPDYENPEDSDRDNLYEVTVRASDGTLHADRMVRVTVENVNEAPAIIAGGLVVSGPTSASVAENTPVTTAVATYTAAGPDAASARWTLSGTDAGDFMISSAGVLTFRSVPDYENAADANTDNTYEVTVVANDGTNTAERGVTVTVTDVEELGCGDALIDRYDADGNCTIQKPEVIKAIGDYFKTPPEATKAEVIRLIGLYFEALAS